MHAIKAKAVVEDANHLRLLASFNDVKQGSEVEIFIMVKNSQKKVDWKNVLESIGTYSDNDLSGFSESRKEFNKWQPEEY